MSNHSVWPALIGTAHARGLTLWVEGSLDVLLHRGKVVPIYATADDLVVAVTGPESDVEPSWLREIDPPTLARAVQSGATVIDLQQAARWFGTSDRAAEVAEFETALDALNLCEDIVNTVADPWLSSVLGLEPLDQVLEVLTMGTTLLGAGSPWDGDPHRVAAGISQDGAEIALQVLSRASEYVCLLPGGGLV